MNEKGSTIDAIINKKSSLIDIINDRQVELQEEHKKFDIMVSLERALGGMVGEILRVIEGRMSEETKEYNLGLLLSQFESPFKEMKEADIEHSFHVWKTWLSFLNGPNNKATDTKQESLRIATEFFLNQWTPEDQKKLEQFRDHINDSESFCSPFCSPCSSPSSSSTCSSVSVVSFR